MSDETKKSVSEQLEEIATRRKARREAAGMTDDDARELARAQAIDAAEEEHGPVGRGCAVIEVVADGPIVIVKKPANATFRKYRDSKDTAEASSKAFVKPCVVHPSAEEWPALLEEYPAVLSRVVKACARLAGYADEEK